MGNREKIEAGTSFQINMIGAVDAIVSTPFILLIASWYKPISDSKLDRAMSQTVLIRYPTCPTVHIILN